MRVGARIELRHVARLDNHVARRAAGIDHAAVGERRTIGNDDRIERHIPERDLLELFKARKPELDREMIDRRMERDLERLAGLGIPFYAVVIRAPRGGIHDVEFAREIIRIAVLADRIAALAQRRG